LGIFPDIVIAQDDLGKITDIQIEGNVKVESGTIRSRLTIEEGDPFSPSAVRASVNELYGMGYFDDVVVEAEGYAGGIRLIYKVVERPIIRSFKFEGNDEIGDDKLREQVTLTPYSVFNPTLVHDNAEKLKAYYQSEGFFNAKVTPVIDRSDDREVRVVYIIEENEKVIIDDIIFEGNEEISSWDLSDVMVTSEYWPIWSWAFSTGTYKLQAFRDDLERIRSLYYNNGFLQVNVDEPVVSVNEETDEITITIHIDEGVQFDIGNISFVGNTVFDTETLFEEVESESGETVNRDLIRMDVLRLTDRYGTKGYAFASISPVIDPHPDTALCDLTFDVDEGPQVYVKRIEITGNSKTVDKVVRRELNFSEGEIYDTSGLKDSYQKLRNLDFFEKIDIIPERLPEEDRVSLKVDVKEKSTGTFSIGGGYSTVDKLVAIGEVDQRNLFGYGQQLSLKVQFGDRHKNYILSFTEPWLLDMPVSLRLDLFNEENSRTGYDVRSTGGGVTLGRRFWDWWGAAISYSYVREKYDNVEIRITDPVVTTGKIGFSLYRDTRDNYMDPRSGTKHSVYAEWAAEELGGDNVYYKVIGDAVWFFPLFWDTALSLHGRIGLVDSYGKDKDGNPNDVQPNDRFYVGGINTVRGLEWGTAGPLFNGSPDGGYKQLIFNVEYTFPLVPDISLRGVGFFDSGYAYGLHEDLKLDKLRYTAGAGFRWMSPLGLIRLEYGFVLDRKLDEDPGRWEFSIGTMF